MLALGSLVANRRPSAGRCAASLTIRTLVAMHEVFDVERAIAGEREDRRERRRGLRSVTRQPLIEPAVDLQFAIELNPTLTPNRRHRAAGCLRGRSPETRVTLEVEPAFEEQAAGADRLRIFRHQGALLGPGNRRPRHNGERDRQFVSREFKF